MQKWLQHTLFFSALAACALSNLHFAIFRQSHDIQSDVADLDIIPRNNLVNTLQTTTTLGNGGTNNDALLSCLEQPGVNCPFESIGKFLEGKGIVHELSPSIPKHRRIPHHMADNFTYIREQAYIQPKNESRTALMDYNPVVLPLYENGENGIVPTLHVDLLDRITGRYHPHFSDADADQVKYLAISRITDIHDCGPGINPNKENGPQTYLGISLWDEELRPIQGTEVAINFSFWILGRYTNDFQDFYISSARTTEGSQYKDGLFLTTSGQSFSYTFPFDVRRVPPDELGSSRLDNLADYDDTWDSKVKGTTIPMNNNELSYGTGLQVRFMDDVSARSGKKYGPLLYRKGPGLLLGKNFHFFDSSNGTTYMEVWPRNPHRVRPINFFASEFASYENDVNYFPGSIKMKKHTVFPHKEIEAMRQGKESFPSQRVLHVSSSMSERGTGCCVDMNLNGNSQVKVGIAHGKVLPRHYLSKFYAFTPNPPFDIVAVSGWFCLGHMLEGDTGFASHWISQRDPSNRTAPSFINNYGNTTCPEVTFTSGMTEMIGHGGENIIISYGVNDCYSRSLIVPKRKIEILLNGKI